MDPLNLYEQFSKPLLHWFALHGRKNLPWQQTRTPYTVWVSEIMLQQTQVQTVIPYFERFMHRFPTIHELAQAQDDEVLALWSGLGYYSRARNLHQTARIICQHHQGIIPNNRHLLMALPGIGRSTAAAILSQAFNLSEAILDGNVKRVLTRFFRVNGHPEQTQVKKKLWELADSCMPQEHCADYTQAIMDLGATCCLINNPNCSKCPLQNGCLALKYQEQALYPTKKVKKTVPIHQQQFLVLHNEHHQIYLEKRPSSGLWGGLWCLPSIELDENPLEFIRINYGLLGHPPEPLLTLKHRFSHFHLEINAWSIKTLFLEDQLTQKQGQWFLKEQLGALGLAKPTQTILTYHLNQCS